MEYEQRPFWFLWGFQKGHSFFIEFSENIICEFDGILVAQQRHKNPGFFFFKKGADFQQPFPNRSPYSGRAAFVIS